MRRAVAPQAAVAFTPVAWGAFAEAQLAAVADDETPLLWYREQVASCALLLWAVEVGPDRVGVIAWRVDHDADGAAFVVVAAAGYSEAFDLMASVLPAVEAKARGLGLHHVRFHTKRFPLACKAKRHGYGAFEYVVRKVL